MLRKHIANWFLVFCFLSAALLAQDATSNRINGVSELLLERANDNFMYILQEDMKANRLLKCYFPVTYQYVTSNNLQLLLQVGSNVWRQSVQKDLEDLGIQLLFKEIGPKELKNWVNVIDQEYLEMLQYVSVKYDSVIYPVNRIPLNAPPELRNIINGFYTYYLSAQSRINKIIDSIDSTQSNNCECSKQQYVSVNMVLENVGEAIDNIKKQAERYKETDIVWSGLQDSSRSIGTNFYRQFASLLEIDQRLKYYQEQIELIRKDSSIVVQVFKLDQLIRTSIESGENPFIDKSELREYNEFSRYALSFAVLSEAESKDQVKAVVQQLLLPPVSFAIKREPGARTFMITAYFGMQGGVEKVNNKDSKYFGGLFVPVGFEFSCGLKNGCISLMVAPFDFANPVNQIINSDEGVAEFKDILNPGAYLSYGFKRIPLVLGAGYSKGQALTAKADGYHDRYLAFLALDMPLYNLF